jgi:hypothetical protein
MNDSELQELIDHLESAAPGSMARSVAELESSDDPVLVLVAALFGAVPERALDRAAGLARTTRDRHLVAIVVAHVSGDDRRAHELMREHLVDHPDHRILAWLRRAADGPTA